MWGSVHKLAAVWPALGAQPLLRDGLALALSAAALLFSLGFARSLEEGRAYGLMIVGALLASPLSWVYYQVLLYLPFLFLLAIVRQARNAATLRIILSATFVTSFLPFAQVLPNLPRAIDIVISFGLSLPLIGTMIALVVAQPAPHTPEPAQPGPDAANLTALPPPAPPSCR